MANKIKSKSVSLQLLNEAPRAYIVQSPDDKKRWRRFGKQSLGGIDPLPVSLGDDSIVDVGHASKVVHLSDSVSLKSIVNPSSNLILKLQLERARLGVPKDVLEISNLPFIWLTG